MGRGKMQGMMEEFQRIYAQVDLDAVRENVRQIKAVLAPKTGIMCVVKADAYGHGAGAAAAALEEFDAVSGFAVATAEEAVDLRRKGIRKPVLVLGYTFPYSYEKLIRLNVRMAAFRYDTLEELSRIHMAMRQKDCSRKAKIHIKVDTGMSRIGITPDREGLAFVKKALGTEGIEVEGIFTHFARADERDKSSAQKQYYVFQEFLRLLYEETGVDIPVKHCSNSAGIVELPEANMDVVRPGIILYGLWPSPEVRQDLIRLTPALSLYSRVVYLKEIEKGTPVSYGGTFVAPKRMRVATIPAGYADGYPRGLSNKGYVLIHGKKAPVIGRVCMDQFMVDVSQIPETVMGDQVTLIGKDGEERITMEMLGDLSGRFNYELACDLGKRIPRIYTKDGSVLCTGDGHQVF